MDIFDPDSFFTSFPRLSAETVRVTSPVTPQYNCIAWAAKDQTKWWWPGPFGYWPSEAPRAETMQAFIEAFALLGYSRCDNADLEEGVEKVALFSNSGMPTHAARQLPCGNWTSKCGRNVDIEHELDEVSGPTYGQVEVILSRVSTPPAEHGDVED